MPTEATLNEPLRSGPLVSKRYHSWQVIGRDWMWDILRCRHCGMEITENCIMETSECCPPANTKIRGGEHRTPPAR